MRYRCRASAQAPSPARMHGQLFDGSGWRRGWLRRVRPIRWSIGIDWPQAHGSHYPRRLRRFERAYQFEAIAQAKLGRTSLAGIAARAIVLAELLPHLLAIIHAGHITSVRYRHLSSFRRSHGGRVRCCHSRADRRTDERQRDQESKDGANVLQTTFLPSINIIVRGSRSRHDPVRGGLPQLIVE